MTNEIIEKLKSAANKAAEEYQKLSKELEEALTAKPRIILNYSKLYGRMEKVLLDNSDEITYYKKYSDEYIEFEAGDCTFRYLRTGDSAVWEFPKKDKSGVTLVTNSSDVFQIYDFSVGKWYDVDYIERIELLEGVKEYDKNRKC